MLAPTESEYAMDFVYKSLRASLTLGYLIVYMLNIITVTLTLGGTYTLW